jgi:hypothetical protein
MDYIDNLDPVLKTFWYLAIPTTLIFVIQTIMTFAGGDAHDGLSADFDSDLGHGDTPFQLFTFRNMINFLLGFSWTGISFYSLVDNRIALIGLSFAIGAGFVIVFFQIIRQIERLAEDNSFRITSALHKTASVYLPIPANKNGAGKVQVSVKGAFHELDAITENNEKIETSAMVRIIRIESNNLVVVEKV